MANGIYAKVKKKIELAEPGTIFLTSDFTDIAAATTVRNISAGKLKKRIYKEL